MRHLIASALKREKNMIYLDNGATTFYKPEAVIQAVADAMRHMGNSGRGNHGASLGATRTIYDTRVLMLDLSGLGDPCRAAFTTNSTTSLNMTIQGLSSSGGHVITTMIGHNSILRPLHMMRGRGVELTIVRADGQGNIQYGDLERAIRSDTKGIVCTHTSNLAENMVDIERVERICTKAPLLSVLDVSQTAGVLDIHTEHMGIDVLYPTSHRSLMESQGTGGICLREGVAIRPLMVGGNRTHSYQEFHPGGMSEALEADTVNGYGIAELHTVLEFIRSTEMETIYCRELMLMRRFYEGALGTPGVTVYGDFSDMDRHALVVALSTGNYDSGEVSDKLVINYGIYIRTRAHCVPLMHQALDTVGQEAVRFSMSYYNMEEEIDQAVQAMRELAV